MKRSTKRILFWALVAALNAPAASVDAVDPFLGSAWPGNTTPAAAFPLGMVQPGPDVGREYGSSPSGYRAAPKFIMGFTQNHLSGTGCCDLQDFLVKPFTGNLPLEPGAVANETAEPGYYAVSFTNFAVRAEMTATRRRGTTAGLRGIPASSARRSARRWVPTSGRSSSAWNPTTQNPTCSVPARAASSS